MGVLLVLKPNDKTTRRRVKLENMDLTWDMENQKVQENVNQALALGEDINYNLQKYVNMTFIDLNAPLKENLVAFLKENFDVDNVDALSDDDYDDLYEKLCDIEVHEVGKSAETNTPVSAYGNTVADIVTYMGNQFIEGGKRYFNESTENK